MQQPFLLVYLQKTKQWIIAGIKTISMKRFEKRYLQFLEKHKTVCTF